LEIFVEFDDGYRAAMSGSQLGVLLTSLNRAEEAIRHSLAALLAIFELTTQWSERDLRLLKQQREQVGAEAFRAEVLLRSSESVFDRMNPLLDQVDVPEEK
jgi:hypothetical protein